MAAAEEGVATNGAFSEAPDSATAEHSLSFSEFQRRKAISLDTEEAE